MCEIDEGVVDVAKKYFTASTAVAFDDPRLELVVLRIFCDLAFYGCCTVRQRPS